MSDTTLPTTAASTAQLPAAVPSRTRAAVAGIVAAAAALAAGELVSALTAGGAPSPLIAVGNAVIAFAPPGSKELMVSLFGTNDKTALNVIVAGAVLIFGALIGLTARRHGTAASLLIAVLVGVGALAAIRDPQAGLAYVALSTGVQLVAGIFVLDLLMGAARPRPAYATGTNADD